MKLPVRVQEIVNELYNRNLDLANGNDDQRRALALKIAQQARFELGPSWGSKRSSQGRPQTKDAVAQKQPDGTILIWDLFNGSTRKPFASPNSMDGSKQYFVIVEGINHLFIPVVVPPVVTPVIITDEQVRFLLAAVAELNGTVNVTIDAVKALQLQVATLTARLANPIVTSPTGVGFLSHRHEVKI